MGRAMLPCRNVTIRSIVLLAAVSLLGLFGGCEKHFTNVGMDVRTVVLAVNCSTLVLTVQLNSIALTQGCNFVCSDPKRTLNKSEEYAGMSALWKPPPLSYPQEG